MVGFVNIYPKLSTDGGVTALHTSTKLALLAWNMELSYIDCNVDGNWINTIASEQLDRAAFSLMQPSGMITLFNTLQSVVFSLISLLPGKVNSIRLLQPLK